MNKDTDLGQLIKLASHNVFDYEGVCNFYNNWWKYCYDSTNGEDFTKMPT